jgi:hypothetical protein
LTDAELGVKLGILECIHASRLVNIAGSLAAVEAGKHDAAALLEHQDWKTRTGP